MSELHQRVPWLLPSPSPEDPNPDLKRGVTMAAITMIIISIVIGNTKQKASKYGEKLKAHNLLTPEPQGFHPALGWLQVLLEVIVVAFAANMV